MFSLTPLTVITTLIVASNLGGAFQHKSSKFTPNPTGHSDVNLIEPFDHLPIDKQYTPNFDEANSAHDELAPGYQPYPLNLLLSAALDIYGQPRSVNNDLQQLEQLKEQFERTELSDPLALPADNVFQSKFPSLASQDTIPIDREDGLKKYKYYSDDRNPEIGNDYEFSDDQLERAQIAANNYRSYGLSGAKQQQYQASSGQRIPQWNPFDVSRTLAAAQDKLKPFNPDQNLLKKLVEQQAKQFHRQTNEVRKRVLDIVQKHQQDLGLFKAENMDKMYAGSDRDQSPPAQLGMMDVHNRVMRNDEIDPIQDAYDAKKRNANEHGASLMRSDDHVANQPAFLMKSIYTKSQSEHEHKKSGFLNSMSDIYFVGEYIASNGSECIHNFSIWKLSFGRLRQFGGHILGGRCGLLFLQGSTTEQTGLGR